MPAKKNIVQGNISHISGSVRIGDDIHVHIAARRLPKELTLSIPRTHPDDLIGREEDLAQLYESLHSKKRVVLVNGLGGIGKTTLVQAYISRYYTEYNHIAWITQDSADIAKDVINTPGLIKNLHIDPAIADPQPLFEEVIRRLKAIDQHPNLLVIDNGEKSLKKYQDILPGQPHWHLLVTSRETITGFHTQSLGFLPEPQAIALFKKHYPYQAIDEAGIQKIVRTFDYYTLAIELLAKTAATQRYDLTTLLQVIQKDLRAGIDVPHNRKKGAIEKIGPYLRTVFILSQLTEEEIWLAQQFICLPPEFHPYDQLRELLVDKKSAHAGSFAATLSDLTNKGWLLHNTDSDSYRMHRVIAGVVQRERPVHAKDIEYLITAVTERLRAEYNIDNTLEKFEWVPYGRAILSILPHDTSPAIAMLQNRLSFVLLNLGEYREAEKLAEKAIRADTRNFGPDHPTTTMHWNNLGLALMDQGEYKRAKAIFEKTIRNDEKNLGKMHTNTAIRYGNLSVVLQYLDDDKAAKKWVEQSIRVNSKLLGEDHFATIRGKTHLAQILGDLGHPRKAKTLLTAAIRMDERHFGRGHPAITRHYNMLANILEDLDEYKAALPLRELVLENYKKVFGPLNNHTRWAYRNLGLLLYYMDNNTRARDTLEKALAISEQLNGHRHATTALFCNDLANVLVELGEGPKAKQLRKRATRIYEQRLGPGHPDTITSYFDLAISLKNADDYAGAAIYFEKVTRYWAKHLGADHPDTLDARFMWAGALSELEEFDTAISQFKKVARAWEKQLGPNHVDTAEAWVFLASVLRLKGRKTAPYNLMKKATPVLTRRLGKNHPRMATIYTILAHTLQDIGNPAAAKSLLEKTIRIDKKHLSPEDPGTGLNYYNMACVLFDLDKYTQALQWTDQAIRIFKKTLPKKHPHLIDAIELRQYMIDEMP